MFEFILNVRVYFECSSYRLFEISLVRDLAQEASTLIAFLKKSTLVRDLAYSRSRLFEISLIRDLAYSSLF